MISLKDYLLESITEAKSKRSKTYKTGYKTIKPEIGDFVLQRTNHGGGRSSGVQGIVYDVSGYGFKLKDIYGNEDNSRRQINSYTKNTSVIRFADGYTPSVDELTDIESKHDEKIRNAEGNKIINKLKRYIKSTFTEKSLGDFYYENLNYIIYNTLLKMFPSKKQTLDNTFVDYKDVVFYDEEKRNMDYIINDLYDEIAEITRDEDVVMSVLSDWYKSFDKNINI